METQWKVNVVNETGRFPYLVIDNWYTPEEKKLVETELNFYLTSKSKEDLHRIGDGPDVARGSDGQSKARGYRWFPGVMYHREFRDISPILRLIKKSQTHEFHQIIDRVRPAGRNFRVTNNDDTIVTYYHEDDEYKAHTDKFYWTQCVWLKKNEEAFEGGDLALADPEQTVRIKDNRCIFFPSPMFHQSTPIKFNKKNPQLGDGKFTITHFYWFK
jgi:hypothetical protein